MDKETLIKIHSGVLKDVLDEFEWVEYNATGMKHMNGGFARAELDDDAGVEDGWVYITLKWGIQDGDEDVVHTEHYKISLNVLLSTSHTARDKVKSITEA